MVDLGEPASPLKQDKKYQASPHIRILVTNMDKKIINRR